MRSSGRRARLALMAAALAVAGSACSEDLSVPGARRDGGGGDAPALPTCKLAACDLVVTEIMSAPKSPGIEWFEIYNNSGKVLSLSGLVMKRWSTNPAKPLVHTIPESRAPTLQPGAYLVVGAKARADGGGLSPGYVWPSLNLPNAPSSSTGVRIGLFCGQTTVAEITYGKTGALPSPRSGLAKQLAPRLIQGGKIACAGATVADNWCDADAKATPYDDAGNRGTPGKTNTACPPPPAPKGKCRDGDKLRDVRAPASGELTVTEIYANPGGTDSFKEWLEAKAGADFDLNGIEIVHTSESGSTRRVVVDTGAGCASVKKGACLVFGTSKDPTKNGKAPVTHLLVDAKTNKAVSQFLYNGKATLEIRDFKGGTVTKVTHGPGASGVASCREAGKPDFVPSQTIGLFDGTGSPGKCDVCPK